MTKCEVCGKEKAKAMGMMSPPTMPKWWCDKCINKALYWGLERYTDAVKGA